MKKIKIVISVMLTTALSAFAGTNPISEKNETAYSFTDKLLEIKSIVTLPALLDIDGDGIKDKEVLSSFQANERTKKISFLSDGKVMEIKDDAATKKQISKGIQNGTWKKTDDLQGLIWCQADGTILKMTIVSVEKDHVILAYGNEKLKITLTLQSN